MAAARLSARYPSYKVPPASGPSLWPFPRAYLRQQPMARRQQPESNTYQRLTAAASERVTPTMAAMSDTELVHGSGLWLVCVQWGRAPGDDP
jgi:hypothetical protein